MNMNSVQAQVNGESKPQKPKHPLSAYNLYFQLERKRILNGTDSLNLPICVEELREVSAEHKGRPKRVHRKSHGKIGFRELARTIANRWKRLDKETRQLLEKQAIVEKKEHAILHKAWKASLGPEGEEAPENNVSPQAVVPHHQPHRPRQQVQEVVDKIVDEGSARMEVLQQLRNQIEAEMARLVEAAQTPRVVSPVSSPHHYAQYSEPMQTPLSLPSQQMQFPVQPQTSSLMPSDWQNELKQEEANTLEPRPLFRNMHSGGFDFQ